MTMRNVEMAWIFNEIADLLEIKGGHFFQMRAYRKAAQVIMGLEQPVAQLIAEGEFQKLPGIGKGIIDKSQELLTTGVCHTHQELLAEIPRAVLEFRALPGIGPAKARMLYQEGFTSLNQLEQAAKKHRLRKLPGISSKIEFELIRNIDLLRHGRDQVSLGIAREIGAELIDYLTQLPVVQRVELAGSTRRWRETVSDLDLVASATNIDAVLDALAAHPRITKTLTRAPGRIQVRSWWGVEIDLTVVPPANFITTWHRCTGSSKHYQQLQQIACQRGLTLDHQHLLTSTNELLPVVEESEIYHHLGLANLPPELRENNGEIELAQQGDLPALVTVDDIKGDLHTHTNWSDATPSLEEMVDQAIAKGYSYLAITDHSRSLKIANGLELHRLLKQGKKIDQLNTENKDFTILKGIECDILSDGCLDFEDDVLRDLDVVVASVHSNFNQEKEVMTQRFIAAIENEHVDIIGHISGRLLGRRRGYQLDIDQIMERAAQYDTILEINSTPDRLDLSEENARKAKAMGIKVAINTDAHDLKSLNQIEYGVSVARRAWLSPDDVINTGSVEDVLKTFG